MQLNPFRLLLPCALPLTLAACAIPGPATAEPPRAALALGVDLGASSRIPKLAGLPGEGEGIGSSKPRAASAPHGSAHGSMPMSQGAMATMDHGSMSGMGHGPMAAKPMDHGSMPGMNHGPTTGTPIRQGSMPGMSHSSAGGPQMAHSGQAHTKASGTVNSVDVAARKVNVTHDPVVVQFRGSLGIMHAAHRVLRYYGANPCNKGSAARVAPAALRNQSFPRGGRETPPPLRLQSVWQG